MDTHTVYVHARARKWTNWQGHQAQSAEDSHTERHSAGWTQTEGQEIMPFLSPFIWRCLLYECRSERKKLGIHQEKGGKEQSEPATMKFDSLAEWCGWWMCFKQRGSFRLKLLSSFLPYWRYMVQIFFILSSVHLSIPLSLLGYVGAIQATLANVLFTLHWCVTKAGSLEGAGCHQLSHTTITTFTYTQ